MASSSCPRAWPARSARPATAAAASAWTLSSRAPPCAAASFSARRLADQSPCWRCRAPCVAAHVSRQAALHRLVMSMRVYRLMSKCKQKHDNVADAEISCRQEHAGSEIYLCRNDAGGLPSGALAPEAPGSVRSAGAQRAQQRARASTSPASAQAAVRARRKPSAPQYSAAAARAPGGCPGSQVLVTSAQVAAFCNACKPGSMPERAPIDSESY